LLTRNQFADAVLVGAVLAITAYRRGSSLTAAGEFARIAVALTSLRIRDDAWARKPSEPGRRARLWTDVTRHAGPGQIRA